MSDATLPQPDPEDREPSAPVRDVVAACIEAMQRGEADPLSRLCNGQPELAAAVQRRLQQLARRGLLPDSTASAVPRQIGPLRVLRPLGGGGMGSVYLAEQHEPVQRQVAVKVIKPGMDTAEVVARFQAERQALASMSHPHIAQVFDAGVTAEGRPYFVMEYVDGSSITSHCDAARLPPAARLQLFAGVCRAVQHAHDKGIIHRDLKPSNVLVTAAGVAKVIDFGIAKLTAPGPGTPQHTRIDQVLGTPEYMSPEQASSGGVDVDTRTDVYSLGVLLYELLCGSLPFESQRLRRGVDFERILREEAPTSPSTRLRQCEPAVAAARGGDPAALVRQVRGELDWIVLRALAKDRAERYPSPLALAEDVERHLAHEPVLAGPPTFGYRLRKLLRRHRVEAAAAALVLLALIAALWVSVRAYVGERRALQAMTAANAAERRAHADMQSYYELARGAVDGLLVRVGDERLKQVPQAERLRRQLLEEALQFYAQLQARQPDDPALQSEALWAQDRMAAIHQELGRQQDAEAQWRQALPRAEALLAAQPEQPAARRLLAAIRGNLGILLSVSGRGAEGTPLLQAALAELDQLAPAEQRTPADAAKAAGLLNALALAQTAAPRTALGLYDAALQQLQRAAGEPGVPAKLALCQANRARALDALGDGDGAIAALQAAVAALQPLASDDDVDARQSLAFAREQLSRALQRHRPPAEAIAAQQQANADWAALAAAHPDQAEFADGLAGGLHRLGDLQEAAGDRDAAAAAYRQAIAARQRLAAAQPQHRHNRMRLARAWLNLGSLQANAARQGEGAAGDAAECFAAALQVIEPLRAEAPADGEIAATAATILVAQATLFDLQQRDADAEATYRRAQALLEGVLRAAPDDVDARVQLVVLLSNLAVTQYKQHDLPGMAASAAAGIEQLRLGLRADAAEPQLQRQLPGLVAKLAHARGELGDAEGALQATAQLVDDAAAGAAARDTGGLLLAQAVQRLDDGELAAQWRPRAAAALRRSLAAAGADARAAMFACLLCDLLPEDGEATERTELLQRAEAALLQGEPSAAGAARARQLAQQFPDSAAVQRVTAAVTARCR